MFSTGERVVWFSLQTFRVSCILVTTSSSLRLRFGTGGDTLLTDPQIITHPCASSDHYTRFFSHSTLSDLGRKLFSKGNVQRTHRDFEKDHECNIFCKFFEVPTSFDQLNELGDISAHTG